MNLRHLCRGASKAEIEQISLELDKLSEKLSVQTYTRVISGERAVEPIVEASVDFDLMILRDTSKRSRIARYFGSNTDKILERAACSVVSLFG